jgi:glutamine amidotransferase
LPTDTPHPQAGAGRREVVVLRTGTANLASVLAGLRRAGAEPETTHDPERVLKADRVVLPGVGAFGAALEVLRAHGLDQAIAERVRAGRPFLGICLGLQMLATGSEESPGVEGLGLLPVEVVRFPPGVRVPQLGWNEVIPTPGARLLTRGFASFANTYHLAGQPEGWEAAYADHGGPFVAAIERGPVLACQFHPELSGAWGHALLTRWLEA